MKVFAGMGFVALLLVLVGCTSVHESQDYQRHSLSRFTQPLSGGDYFWFDVKITPQLPLESEGAEQVRLAWLQSWLDQRGVCGAGYEVLERRPFDFLEYNPERLDLRYKVQCVVPVPPDAG